jgi:hypothetical protein
MWKNIFIYRFLWQPVKLHFFYFTPQQQRDRQVSRLKHCSASLRNFICLHNGSQAHSESNYCSCLHKRPKWELTIYCFLAFIKTLWKPSLRLLFHDRLCFVARLHETLFSHVAEWKRAKIRNKLSCRRSARGQKGRMTVKQFLVLRTGCVPWKPFDKQ